MIATARIAILTDIWRRLNESMLSVPDVCEMFSRGLRFSHGALI